MIRHERHQYFCLFLNGYKLVTTADPHDWVLYQCISSINYIAILYDLITMVHVI